VAPFAIVYSNLNPTSLGFQPYVDGVTIPAQPWSIGPKVPMIIGSNSLEGGIFTLGTYGIEISAANYSSFLTTSFGPAASTVAEQYPLTLSAFTSTGKPGFAAIATVMTEAMFYCPVYQALLKAESNDIPVYTYLNSHTPSCPAVPLPIPGATHNTEIPYVFGNAVNQQGGSCNFSAAERVISEELIAAWSAMASTGNPSVPGAWQWPQWNNNTSKGVNIVNASSVGVVDYSRCAFWDMIDNTYLNFTSSSTNTTSGSGNGTGGKTGHSAGSRPVIGIWGLVIAVGISVSTLI
jgi:carboxylesterase type B